MTLMVSDCESESDLDSILQFLLDSMLFETTYPRKTNSLIHKSPGMLKKLYTVHDNEFDVRFACMHDKRSWGGNSESHFDAAAIIKC